MVFPEHSEFESPYRSPPGATALAEPPVPRPGIRHFRDLANNMLQLAWMADGEGRFFWFNRRWYEFTGTTPADMQGEGWRRVHDPALVESVAAKLRESFSRGETWEDTFPMRAADGTYRWFLSRAEPVRDRDGHVLCWYGTCTDVTEQRRSSEEVERRGRQLEAILQSIQDAVIVVDRRGDFVFINDAAARLGGFRDSTEIHRGGPALRELFEIIGADGNPLPTEQKPLSRIMRGESLNGWELPMRRTDTGSEWICSFSGQPVIDRAGEQFLSVLIMRDVTDQRRAEQELFKNAALVRAITDSTSDLIFAKDRAGHYIMANPSTAAAIDRSEAEMIGRTDITLLRNPEYAAEVMANDQRILEKGESEVVEERDSGPDGSVRTWLATKTPFRDHTGQVVGLVGIAREITERKRREEDLSAREAWFRLLAESMPQIVWTAEPEGRLDHWNRRAAEYTGVEDYTGQTLWKSVVHPDDVPAIIQAWDDALAKGEMLSIELRVLRNDGAYRWHLARAVPVTDPEGRIFKWIGTMTDIDDQKRAKEILEQRIGERTAELEHRSEELQASNRELEQFAYVASHDLQEPLRTVTSFAQLLVRRYGAGMEPEAREFIGFIVDGSRRMQHLIQDLLAFSRVGRVEEDLFEVEAEDCLRTATSDLDAEIRESGGTVNWSPLPRIQVRPRQLTQLFQNLVNNALKFHRPGVPPVVEISASRSGEDWVFSVRDNGIGIAPEYRERVFHIFQRLHTRQEHPGSGIGLAICKKIVEGHGGRIWVEEAPGGGCEFRFTLAKSVGRR